MDSSEENLPLSQETLGFLLNEVDPLNKMNSFTMEEILQILKENIQNNNETEILKKAHDFVQEAKDAVQNENNLSEMIPVLSQQYIQNISKSSKTVNDIPANTNWPGPYGFDISFGFEEKKNANCVYSEIKDKIFVNMAVACSLNFKLKKEPPDGSIIRAMPIFSKPEFITEVVKRCLIHAAPSDTHNEGHPAPDHLIRCDHKSASYIEDSSTKRQSVTVLYEKPHIGVDFTPYIYRFMCLGSCIGGLNRRALQVIFTLEKDGIQLGRKVLNVRICACPVRDRRTEERQHNRQHRNLKRVYSKMNLTACLESSSPKISRIDDYVTIKIRRKHYDYIKKVLDALDILDILTEEQKLILQQRQSQRSNLEQQPLKHSSSEDNQEVKQEFQNQNKESALHSKKEDTALPSTSGNIIKSDSETSDCLKSSLVSTSRKIMHADKLKIFDHKYLDQHNKCINQQDTTLLLPSHEFPIITTSDIQDDYEFSVLFAAQENIKKNNNWTYSDIKKKLYVNMGVACPIRFKVKKLPPPGTIIRATPIFTKPEFTQDIVKRCIIHSSPGDKYNEGHPAPEHLIRCDNASTQYLKCPITKRLNCAVSYENPQVGMDYSLYIYRFMCLGSCVGGLNRRALQVVFTLEKDDCCLGKKIIDVRICACPGRDRRIEERRHQKQYEIPKKAPLKFNSSSLNQSYPILKQHYYHYETIKKILDTFDAIDLLNEEQKHTLQQMKLQRFCQSSLKRKSSGSFSGLSDGNQQQLKNKLFKKNNSNDLSQYKQLTSSQPDILKDNSIRNWLSSFGMAAYNDKFKEHNFIHLEQLHNFTLQDLQQMKIGVAHSNKIWEQVKIYQESLTNSIGQILQKKS